MNDLTGRVARAIEGVRSSQPESQARAAIREVLAAMHETSEARAAARLAMWRDPRARVSATDWLASVVAADIDAFAREHGIEP